MDPLDFVAIAIETHDSEEPMSNGLTAELFDCAADVIGWSGARNASVSPLKSSTWSFRRADL